MQDQVIDSDRTYNNIRQSSSSSLSLRIKKNLIGKFSRRCVLEQFVTEEVTNLIESFYQVLITFYDFKLAGNIVKNVLKLSLKIGVLIMNADTSTTNNQGIKEQISKVENKFRALSLTMSSFQAIYYSYNFQFLETLLRDLKSSIQKILDENLSEKSTKRLNFVFDHVMKKSFLDQLFIFPTYTYEPIQNDNHNMLMEKSKILQTFCDNLVNFSQIG